MQPTPFGSHHASALLTELRLVEPLGRGACGESYLATRPRDPRRYVVKLLPDDAEDLLVDLRNEARVLWRVAHPSLRLPLALGPYAGRPALVLEYVDGTPLHHLAPSEGLAQAVLEQVLPLLDALHRLGVVHGDIKPSNLILDARGEVHLIDFGLARRLGAEGDVDEAPGFGTPAYMSPETLFGAEPSPASDLYSLGAVVFDKWIGRAPSLGEPPPAGHLSEPIAQLLDRDPAARGASAPDPSRRELAVGGEEGAAAALAEWLDAAGPGVCVAVAARPDAAVRVIDEATRDRRRVTSRCYPFAALPLDGLDWVRDRLGEEAVARRLDAGERVEDLAEDVVAALGEVAVVVVADAHLLWPLEVRLLRSVMVLGRLRVVLAGAAGATGAWQMLGDPEVAGAWGYAVFPLRVAEPPLASSWPAFTTDDAALVRLLRLHPPGLPALTAARVLASVGHALPSVPRLARRGLLDEVGGRLVATPGGTDEAPLPPDPALERSMHAVLLDLLDDAPVHERVHHLAASGRPDEAVQVAVALAVKDLALGDADSAVAWLRRAIGWADGGDVDPIRRSLAAALESAGRLQEAIAVLESLGDAQDRFVLARCHFDASDADRGYATLAGDLAALGLSWRGWSAGWRLVRALWSGWRWAPHARASAGPDAVERAEVAWLLARGYVFTRPFRAMIYALEAVEHGTEGHATEPAGRAMAFLAAGVFVEVPGFAGVSRRWREQVRAWGSRSELLFGALTLWEAVGSANRGEWAPAEVGLDRARPALVGHRELNFERVAWAVTRLLVAAHRGDYLRLLHWGTLLADESAGRGARLHEASARLFLVQAFLAGEQASAARDALRLAAQHIPAGFSPQRFELMVAECCVALHAGDAEGARDAFVGQQGALWRSGGLWVASTRLRNALVGLRVGAAAGDRALLRRAKSSLDGMDRADASAFAAWAGALLDGTATARADELSKRFARGHADAIAAAFAVAAGEAGAVERLRRRGVADPSRWAAWAAPTTMASG